MSAMAQQVVEQFNEIVKPDGGSVTFVSADDGVLRVRYAPGSNDECETCVMAPDSLAAMMKDMVQGLDPSIQQVEIEE
jgi:Fe-S cluster biogenesis protein NfuA